MTRSGTGAVSCAAAVPLAPRQPGAAPAFPAVHMPLAVPTPPAEPQDATHPVPTASPVAKDVELPQVETISWPPSGVYGPRSMVKTCLGPAMSVTSPPAGAPVAVTPGQIVPSSMDAHEAAPMARLPLLYVPATPSNAAVGGAIAAQAGVPVPDAVAVELIVDAALGVAVCDGDPVPVRELVRVLLAVIEDVAVTEGVPGGVGDDDGVGCDEDVDVGVLDADAPGDSVVDGDGVVDGVGGA